MIAVLTATTIVNAQNIKYGVRTGLNFAKVKVTSDSDVTISSKRRTGFYVGGFLESKMNTTNGKLYGEIGLNYSSEGGKSIDRTTKMIVDFIKLNTSLKYEVYKNAFIKGGLYLGYVVSSVSETDNISQDMFPNSNIFDLGVPLGIEYNLNNGMFFNLNYNIGITTFDLEDEFTETVKNRVLQLGIGYKF